MSEAKRSKRINVRLSDDLSDRLDVWSKKMGVPPSTLAALAIGEYLNTKEVHEANMQKSSLLVSRQIGNSFAELFANPESLAQLFSGLNIDEGEAEKAMKEEFEKAQK